MHSPRNSIRTSTLIGYPRSPGALAHYSRGLSYQRASTDQLFRTWQHIEPVWAGALVRANEAGARWAMTGQALEVIRNHATGLQHLAALLHA